ncbi:MAG: hypothetical protein FWG64_05410, partial [Firmicutes bacterium]|nr:hypothetical protein [Bacillota bacterium]
MKFTKTTKNRIHKQTAFLLVFVMLFSMLPSRQVFATELSAANSTIDNFLNPPIVEIPTVSSTSTNPTILSTEQPSQARQNYYKLLEGNYFAFELRQRFVELFGEFSTDYIRQNYPTIFDMPSEQVD